MDVLSLADIALMSQADLVMGDPYAKVTGISTNTRQLQPGELYVALRGEHFDGNQFIQEAISRGAVGAICDGEIPQGLPSSFGILRVTDGLQSLTSLAAAWRKSLSLCSIVLTGSIGKTTTKDFTAAVLRRSLKTSCTQGNLNNHIGLPLSILKASTEDQVAVWEIGMNHRGEIAPLAALAQPDIAIITNIGTAHIGFLGSREAIAQEKGDLLAQLPSYGLAILPASDEFCEELVKRTTARVMRVGINAGDLQAHIIKATAEGTYFDVCYEGGSYSAFLPVIGAHMVTNALLALAAGMECGVSLAEGISALKNVSPSKSRLALKECHGLTLIDDTYNANPDSMEAALKTMASLPVLGQRIAVLGCMGELGEYALTGYQNVGKVAASVLQILIVVGTEVAELARAARAATLSNVYEVKNNQEALKLLSSLVHTGDLVLVKGSLSANLKEVTETITSKEWQITN